MENIKIDCIQQGDPQPTKYNYSSSFANRNSPPKRAQTYSNFYVLIFCFEVLNFIQPKPVEFPQSHKPQCVYWHAGGTRFDSFNL